jgi:sec-independent protein translocase protein TatA
MFEGLFQPMHLLVILGIALLVFGPKKLPELGKGLGESIRGFKDALSSGAASSHPAPPPAESKPPAESQNPPGPTP